MFVELQLSAGVFGRILRERLRALDICIDQTEADEYVEATDGVETRLVVNRIEVLEETEVVRQAEPSQVVWIDFPHNYTSFVVPYLQVRQAVAVSLVDVAKLAANGVAPTPPDRELTLRLVFNVSADVPDKVVGQAGAVRLRYELDHLDLGVLNAVVPPELRARIESIARRYQLPTTALDLGSLSGLTPGGSVGLAAFNAGITCDAGGQRVAVRVETRRDADLTADWYSRDPEAFVDEVGGRQWGLMVDGRILSAAIQALMADGLSRTAKVRLRGGPTVSYDPRGPGVVIALAGEAVDACPFFVDDIDVDFDADIRVALSVPATNTMRTHFAIDVSPSDVGEQVGCAVTMGLLWPFIGLILVDKGEVDLPKYIGGYVLGVIGRVIAVFVALATATLPDDVDPLPGLQARKIDDEHYEYDSPIDVSPRGLGARLELATVSGGSTGPVLSGPVVFQRNPPAGSVPRIDVTPFTWRLAGRCGEGFSVVDEAEIFVAVAGTGARLCSVRLLADEHNAFALRQDGNSVTISCTFPPAYQAGPRYPCRVRVVTNRGVRTITIAAPVDATEAETNDLETERIGRIGACKGWLQYPIKDIRWIVDPPDVLTDPRLHFWQVVVKGLRADDRVTLRVPDGSPLVTAVASRHGVAHLSVLLDAAEGIDYVHAELDGEIGATALGEVTVQQVLFVRRSTVPARGRLRELAFERRGGQHVLRFRGDREEHTWDVAPRGRPALVDIRAIASQAGREVVVHTGKRVTELSRLPDLRERARPLESSATALMGSPRVGGLRRTLFVGDGDTGVLFDVTTAEQREAQTYHRQPWFVGLAMHGALLARHDPRRHLVELYEAVASRQI